MTTRSAARVTLLATSLLLAACATNGSGAATASDPLEPVNRPFFSFNDAVDRWVLDPVAEGWVYITPQLLRDSISNFYTNIAFPRRFVSSLGQGDGHKAATEFVRFAVNTTVGVGGLFDPASATGVAKYDEDMGQMLGRWGVGAGPYLVIPLIGPANPRDTAGMILDTALNPLTWVLPGAGLLAVVNSRAQADEQIESSRRTALDYYVFVRNAYTQNRRALVLDSDAPGTPHQGYDYLYDYEDDELDAPAP